MTALPRVSPLPPTRVAVVDDDPVFLDLMRDVLTEKGYIPYLFAVGAPAYARMRALAPDALVLDVHAERPHPGWLLLDLCRQDPALCEMTIVICSEEEREARTRAAASPGAAVALRKPFELGELLALLPPGGRPATRVGGRELTARRRARLTDASLTVDRRS